MAQAEQFLDVWFTKRRYRWIDDLRLFQIQSQTSDFGMNGGGVAEQDGSGDPFFQDRVAGAQDFFIVAFGKDDVLGFGLGFVNHHARDLMGFTQMTLELVAVCRNVDRLLRHSGVHRCLGHG